jgi:hypothetical protein
MYRYVPPTAGAAEDKRRAHKMEDRGKVRDDKWGREDAGKGAGRWEGDGGEREGAELERMWGGKLVGGGGGGCK